MADTLSIDGKVYNDVCFPFVAKVKNGYKASQVVAYGEGYEDISFNIYKEFNGAFIANFVTLGVPGIAVDVATGAVKKVIRKDYYIKFVETSDKETSEPISLEE